MFKLRHVLELILVSDMPIISGEYLISVKNFLIKFFFFAKLLILKWIINDELFYLVIRLGSCLEEKYSSSLILVLALLDWIVIIDTGI